MTDQKDDLAPDYIWAMREVGSDDMDAGTFCSVDDGGTKYIRSDLAEARVALAVEAAYREGFQDGDWVATDHEDEAWIDSNARAALAEIKE